MKPYTVVMQVRKMPKHSLKPSQPVYVYATDRAEAAVRARRVLEIESWDCAETPLKVTEGWPKNLLMSLQLK